MRDCQNAEIRDLLPDYVGGPLAGAARARVEAHLATCAACRAEVALLREVRAAHPLPRVSPADVARIVASLPRPARAGEAAPGVVSLDAHRARREAARRPVPWRRMAALAAVFAGVVGVGVFGRRDGGRSAEPLTVPPAETAATTPFVADTPRGAPGAQGATIAPAPVRIARETVAARVGTTEALGALGGIASGADEDEIEALLAGLESMSGIPDVEAGEAESSDETGGAA